MLLPWYKRVKNGELRVFIQPQRIELLRLSRPLKHGFKQHLVRKQIINLPLEVTDLFQQQAITQALTQALTSEQWRGVAASVVLSNHFVHYAVIPWNAELTTENERQLFMQHCFNQVYGESSKTWDFRMNAPAFGQAAIASAISKPFLQALHEVFAEAEMTLTEVHPHFMLAINQTLSEVKKHHQTSSFWLVAIQTGQLCLALVESGDWRLVKNVALDVDVSTQVGALIQRAMVNNNIQGNLPKFLYWPASQYEKAIKLGDFDMIKILPHAFDMQSSQSTIITSSTVAA